MIARGLTQAGANVYISSRKADVCDAAATEIAGEGNGTCISLPADLSTEPGCRHLAEMLSEHEDRLHILVNNAGATWGAPLDDFDDAAWDRVLSLNVKGVFHLTRFLLPLLENAAAVDDPARVVNIGSIDGLRVPELETYSYSASKAAVHQLTRHLAKRAPTITVNAIAPGPFPSKMMAATLETYGDQIVANAPLKRIGRPDDVAGATIFLVVGGQRRDPRGHPGRRRHRDAGVTCGRTPLVAQPARRLAGASPVAARSRARLDWPVRRPRGPAWSSTDLRRRTLAGVTSTHSSSRMNSSACSSESSLGGMRRTSSSAVEDRTFVTLRSLVGLMSMSSERAFSPMTIPS